ncbi:TlpA family protein disulfide reductase [Salibacterium sp. K-3]
MRYFQKRLMFLTLCGLICITGLFYQASYNPAKQAAGYPVSQSGEQVADLELTGINKQTYQLGSFMDKPLLITFFATWCGICQRELPQLSSYHEKHEGEWNMAAVNVTTQEYDQNDVYSFARNAGLNIPVLLDTKGKAAEAFRVRGVPTSILLNERGVILKTFYGPIEKEQLEEELTGADVERSSRIPYQKIKM